MKKKKIFYIVINLGKKAKIYLAQHQKNKSLEQSCQLEMFSSQNKKLVMQHEKKTCRQNQYFEKKNRKLLIFQSLHR